jgi:hypothetical protein
METLEVVTVVVQPRHGQHTRVGARLVCLLRGAVRTPEDREPGAALEPAD